MQVPEDPDAAHYIFAVWNDHYDLQSNSEYNKGDVTEEQSMIWDKEATQKAIDEGPINDFPIPLKEMKIPFGKFFVFDAKEFLHAGGPGKSSMILTR